MRARLLLLLALPLALALALAPSVALAKPRWQELPLPLPAMPAATSTGRVDVAGASLYYAIYGKGEPVILLHGGLGNADHFANQVPALADKFQVIAIDSRGQGRSTLSKATLTYRGMADDVIAVMDKLELQKAAIVGWSDGGEIAPLPRDPPPRARREAVRRRCQLRLQRLQAAQGPVGADVRRVRRQVPRGLSEAVEDAEVLRRAGRRAAAGVAQPAGLHQAAAASRSPPRPWSPTATTTRSSCSTRSRRWRP